MSAARRAWPSAYERGLRAGHEDLVAGAPPERWAERARERGGFAAGYVGGRTRAVPHHQVPAPPVVAALEALAGAGVAGGRVRADTAALMPFALAAARIEETEGRRRARRLGLVDPTSTWVGRVGGRDVLRAVSGAGARWMDARARGTWPPSRATLLGVALAGALERELRFRRDLACWRMHRAALPHLAP